MMNGFQNNKWGVPMFATRRSGGQHMATLTTPFGESMTGYGRNPKAAENACALEACRMMSRNGLLQRQVSAKQRKNKGSKGAKKGAKAEAKAQKELAVAPLDGPPFVLPFFSPTYNGANIAKKVKVMNNGSVNSIAPDATMIAVLDKAMSTRWVQEASPPARVLNYHELEREIHMRGYAARQAKLEKEREVQRLNREKQLAKQAARWGPQGGRYGRSRYGGYNQHQQRGRPQFQSKHQFRSESVGAVAEFVPGGAAHGDDPLAALNVATPAEPKEDPAAVAAQRTRRDERQDSPQVAKLRVVREQLPVFARKDEVLEASVTS